MSSACTSGRHGVPSLFIATCRVVQARPDRLLSTMSKRCRGEAPNAVALRMNVGEKSSLASARRSRSTSVLQSAYAVCGFTGLVSSTVPSATP
jgi:hypothetical protein